MRHSFTDRDGVMVGIDGDVANAASLLSFAKGRIISMRELFGNDSIHSNSFLINGSVVFCKIDNEKSWVFIKGEGGDPEFLHGMVDGGTIQYINADGNVVSEPGEGIVQKVQRFYPSSDQAVIEGIPERVFRKEPNLAVQAGIDIDYFKMNGSPNRAAQSGIIQASLYSGRMRKIVQVLLGKVDHEVEYRWGFYKTDGVLVDGNGNDWLIRIANGVGVIATRMDDDSYSYGTDASNDLVVDAIGYIPSGNTFPKAQAFQDALARGTIIRLLDQPSLNQFYTKQPFYDDCGWCFNESGTEAQNTCWAGEGDFNKSFRYKISISLDEETGKPKEASITLVESDWLYNYSIYTRFQVPKESNGNELKTFPMHPTPISLTPPFTSFDSPVHVWYDGNSEKVLRYVWKTSGVSVHDNGYDPGTVDVRGPVVAGTFTGISLAGGMRLPMTSDSNVSYMDLGTPSASDVFGFDIPGLGFTDYRYSTAGMRLSSLSTGSGGGQTRQLFSPYNNYSWTASASGKNRWESRTDANSARYSSVAISPRDRSGIFVGKIIADTWSARTIVNAEANAFSADTAVTNTGPSTFISATLFPKTTFSNFSSIIRSFGASDAGDPGGFSGPYVSEIPFWMAETNITQVGTSINYIATGDPNLHIHEYTGGADGIGYESTGSDGNDTYSSSTSGAGGDGRRLFYYISDMTGVVETPYDGVLIDDYADFFPDPVADIYLTQYSSHSYIKGSSLFSSEPFAITGDKYVVQPADGEPLDQTSSHVAWVGVS